MVFSAKGRDQDANVKAGPRVSFDEIDWPQRLTQRRISCFRRDFMTGRCGAAVEIVFLR